MDPADRAIGSSGRLRPSPDVISRRLDRAGVLVHLPTNRIFELNETGIRLWELIKDEDDTRRIVSRLAEEFDVEVERADRDVRALLHWFQQEGLVES
jgi:hypothetical protein